MADSRRQSEESEDRPCCRPTFDNPAIGIAHISLEGDILRVNDRLCELLRRERDTLIGRSFLEVTNPEDHDEDQRCADELLGGRVAFCRLERQCVRGDGSRLWAKIIVTSARELADAPQFFVAFVEDVSVRRRQCQSLEEAARHKDRFIAMLGHELRNPLAAMSFATQLLRQARDEEDVVEDALGTLERQVGQMTRMVDDLLDVSRMARGKLTLERARVDLVCVLRQVVASLRPRFEEKGLQLEETYGLERALVEVDATRFQQVFNNLLVNAMKFTDAPGQIMVRTGRRDEHIELEISDTGVGIEPAARDRIFEPFQQVEHTTHRSNGLGLGLALVRGIVELHGGHISVHSAGQGKGATFVVRLPLCEQLLEAHVSPEVHKREARILVIEDNLDVGRMLCRSLEAAGHECDLAADGPSGLELARDLQPDVVICDIGLPGMSGYDVARALRADPDLSPTCIVALSGFGRKEDERLAIEAGFDGHLRKPATVESIEALIDRFL